MTTSVYYTISTNQKATLLTAPGITLANCRYPIVCLHGHTGSALDGLMSGVLNQGGYLTALALAGYGVVALDAGGAGAWSSPAAMSAIDAAFTTIGRSKVGILGYSMGGLTALNWIKRNPTKVEAAYLLEPVSDLDWVYSDPLAGGWTAEVDTAYGTPYSTTTVGYRVHDEPASFRNLGFPIKIAHATDDEVVPYSQTTGLIAAINDPMVTQRTPDYTGGHTQFWGNLTPAEIQAHFDSV